MRESEKKKREREREKVSVGEKNKERQKKNEVWVIEGGIDIHRKITHICIHICKYSQKQKR